GSAFTVLASVVFLAVCVVPSGRARLGSRVGVRLYSCRHPTKRRRLGAPPSEVLDSYVCTICGRVFAHRAHWAKHVQVHRKSHGNSEKSYTCDICGKKLTRLDGYQKHRRVHTGEKPYTCGQCGRSFSDNSNYKRHVRTHAGQRTSQS
uniref:C2H2-type domain-containing protein n=1 Tax=Cynoglossus semilaevis TaxID=244447 RepID=A0A3P8X0Z1_CYNSE